MTYSYKLDKALDQTPSGNISKYFDYQELQIQENDGRSDNKCLSIDAYDPPCPVAKGMYTKLKLTDESVNIINIDKSSITAVVKINVAAASTLTHSVFSQQLGTAATATMTCAAMNKYINALRLKMNKIFVGFKSGIHVLDAYRIYSNGKKTLCEQTEALFENAAMRMLKCQEELDEKPGIYTTWRHAYMYEEQVCGTYITIDDLLQGVQTVEFELTIPIDEFLPFQAMTLFPNCIFGNLQIEIKMAIQNNFVCCQTSTYETAVEVMRSLSSTAALQGEYISPVIRHYTELSKAVDSAIKKTFTQCGDTFDIAVLLQSSDIVMADNVTIYHDVDEHCTQESLLESFYVKTYPFTVEITAGQLMSCRTNLNGFNIKDSTIDKLREKFSENPLIIPSQFIDYQAFSQPPMSFGLKCNTTYNLTNCSSILFLFPRTNHEVTCSRNPFLGSIQVQIDNKPYPDKPFSTMEAAHTIYNLTNIGYDSLFSTSEEYSYSLTWNELAKPIDLNDANPYKEKESEDNTSYCFVCATERLSGFGTFCDGLNKDNAHITLTGTLASLPAGIQYHPYYQPDGNVNNRPPIMLICQDCFWRCTPEGGMEFIINDKQFYKTITENLS